MSKPEQPLFDHLVVCILLVCSALMTIVSFLGFLGWSSDPSNQKWWALGCSVFGATATSFLWMSKNEPINHGVILDDTDKAIKKLSARQQQQHWKKEIRISVIWSSSICGFFVLARLLFSQWIDFNLFMACVFTFTPTMMRISRALQELSKIRRQQS